jgi:dynein heavy chain
MLVQDYPVIEELKTQIKPYENLWNLVAEFEQKMNKDWVSGALKTLVPEEIESDYKRMSTLCKRLINIFESNKLPKPLKIAQNMKKDFDDFKKYVPIIKALCNPGLQARHIEEIFQTINFPPPEGEELLDMKLDTFKNLKIEQYKDKLEEISEFASKEFGNDKTMKTMVENWEPLAFDCKAHTGSESYTL